MADEVAQQDGDWASRNDSKQKPKPTGALDCPELLARAFAARVLGLNNYCVCSPSLVYALFAASGPLGQPLDAAVQEMSAVSRNPVQR